MGRHAAIARRFYEEVWNQRREAAIDELMAPDLVGKMEGGDVAGPAQFKQMRQELLQAFPDLNLTVEDVIEEGDKVVVRWSVIGTHRGPLAGTPPTNRPPKWRSERPACGKRCVNYRAGTSRRLF